MAYGTGNGAFETEPAAEPADRVKDPGEIRLNELGYKQELRRELNFVEILAVSVSVMNPYITVIPFYAIAISYGGPQNVMWPWWPVAACSICVGLCLSEICSSFPTTGSLYFWAASMAPHKWKPLVSWVTAWFEVIALVVGSASVAFPATQIIQQIILLTTGTNKNGGYFAPKWLFFLIFMSLEIQWAALNTLSIKMVSLFTTFFVYFNIVYTAALVIMLPLVARTTQKASYVYFHYEDSAIVTGVSNTGINFLFAMLLPQFCFFGYDSSAHVTEETKNAASAGPKAIMTSIFVELVLGYALLNAFTFSIQGYWADLFDPANETRGLYPPAQILYDAFHGRYGSGAGAYVFLILMVIPFYASGVGGVLAAARALYATSRDGAMPASWLWRKLNKAQVPVYAAWLVALICTLICLPNFGTTVAFNAIVSVATIAWVGTYGVPIFFRLILPNEDFNRGPFHLGAFSKPLCFISLCYIVYTCGIFMVPLTYPVTWNNYNYGPIASGLVLAGALLWFALDARKWFHGPVRNIDMSMSKGNNFQPVKQVMT
eukprot:SM000062S19938  [mRNA]  locus=s62:499844:503705:- [translate_table: standard]